MNKKILFMVIDNKVKYLSDSDMDHREWYKSLNLDLDEFDNVVRGFILDNKIVFYKGLFKYDNETIDIAEKMDPEMRKKLNNPNLEVYCGVYTNEGEKWEPIHRVDNPNINNRFEKDTNIEKKTIEKSNDIKEELDPLIEIKNNYEDPKIVKRAMIGTIIVLIINIILKIVLYKTNCLVLSNTLDTLLVFIQFILLIVSIYLYNIKNKLASITSLAAAVTIVLTFNIFDIILGLIYFIFMIDQSIFSKIVNKIVKK